MRIKNLPPDDRPREKLWVKGVAALSNAELLAVLLRTGSKGSSALDIARDLTGGKGQFITLKGMKPVELALKKGIGQAKAVTVAAALELGRRLATAGIDDRRFLDNAADAAEFLEACLGHEDREVFLALCLGAKGQLIFVERIAEGSLLSAVVTPRDVFQAAFRHRAAAVILAHNHPSGDPAPSSEDIELTRRFAEAGKIVGVVVADHIIIGTGKYYSFSENGVI